MNIKEIVIRLHTHKLAKIKDGSDKFKSKRTRYENGLIN